MRYLCFDSALNGVYTLLQLQKLYPAHISLFKDKEDNRLWDVAPWLFEIDDVDVFNRWDGEHDHIVISLKRCIIFETPVKINSLCEHLQQFLYKTIDGRKHYNRFWDAKILKQQLEKFDTKQLLDFFEEIEYVYMQDETTGQFTKYFLDKKNRITTQAVRNEDLFAEGQKGREAERQKGRDTDGQKEKQAEEQREREEEKKTEETATTEETKPQEKPRRRFFSE